MADIKGKILKEYGIDISQDNLFKLYKIFTADITQAELDAKFADARRRWTTSVNGANEKNAERDRVRLQNADKYEAVLGNAKLRKELFKYYNSGSTEAGTAVAKEYFSLIATTKKIKKSDVDFYFKWYPSERKNKKAIIDMLEKNMKVIGIGKAGEEKEEKEEKRQNSNMIVNLFQMSTLTGLQKVVEKYGEAKGNTALVQKIPQLNDDIYAFTCMSQVEDAVSNSTEMFSNPSHVAGIYSNMIDEFDRYFYGQKQEFGDIYIPLVDMFNTLKELGTHKDVLDNIHEFCLLLKYPDLTPYMYSFVDMKPDTLKRFAAIACNRYNFRDETDFLLTYFIPVHDNFGINDVSVKNILKKAEKKAKQNETMKAVDKKLGHDTFGKTSFVADFIHVCVYFPLYIIYFMFEVAKVLFTKISYLKVPVFVAVFIMEIITFPNLGFGSIFDLASVVHKEEWISFLSTFINGSVETTTQLAIVSVMVFIKLLSTYILPPLLLAIFISEFASSLNKNFDWVGYQRSFDEMLTAVRRKTAADFREKQGGFTRYYMPKIFINVICIIVIIIGVVVIRTVTGN